MPRAIPIRRPTPDADRPNPRSLALLALACFGVGLALVAKTLPHPATPARVTAPVAPTAHELPTARVAAPATAPPRSAAVAAPPAVAPSPGRAANTAAHLTPSGVRIERGRIAYIRCEGVPQRPGPVPCPRDPAMERIAWTAIDALATRCPALAIARGTADVRVVFDGRRFSGLGFHPVTPPALAEAIRACLEPQLNGLTQSLGATRLTASFRFDVK